ncbi:hypothetical protein BGW36DRAFT_426327 [Talaromyces proteolyticus]|uniref:Uncharacterized protein n=1 Tax=Talaromyces proteolyticus TaxID=1131652 RepID=A0AAD4KWS8_9EURO|nr:uncharacterized protein BGW36DRAFT_426327 [Talaromyces proteolyticus]KAH8698632.1 hypothetical protein BGW36DRAFT_426327 [Talaromyces proteolyticus]
MDCRYLVIQDEASSPALDDLVTSALITKGTSDDHPTPRKSPQPLSSRQNEKDGVTYASVPTVPFDELDDTDEGGRPLQSTKALTGAESRDLLPAVDIGSGTKLQCLLTIALGVACFLACIICSIGFWTKSTGPPLVYLPKGLPGEALSFIVNIILTQCLEGLAYVHSVSLRWALLKENRLVFNTNIRLAANSRLSRPNSWYINSISATLLILCYAATSMLVMPRVDSDEGIHHESHINLIALLALGLALFGQTLLAFWCYYNNLRDIPSWSSNPLNTTLTILNQQLVQHREGRCIDPVQIRDTPDERPMLPRKQQPSQWQVSTSARNAIIFIWILTGLSFVWFLTIVLVARANMIGAINKVNHLPNAKWHFSLAWDPSGNPIVGETGATTYFNAVFFSLDYVEQIQSMSFVAALIVGLLFVCIIQGLQTLGLHCAELIVNLSRDEDVWRALDAQDGSGAKNHVLKNPPILAALMSWKYLTLLIFKSLLHWLLGQSSQPSFDYIVDSRVWFTMNYARLFVYVICAAAFASALTFLTFMKPKGPQPATYGHIQTIADLIDDWTLNENGRFWWGDKGCTEGVRHAGMSSKKTGLGQIQMNTPYAGELSRRFIGSTKFINKKYS